MDLTERLRMTGAPNYQSQICAEAADEIERLRSVLKLAVPALELGVDALRAEATAYHAAMKGYRPASHAQRDEDCDTAAEALRVVLAVLGPNV